MHRRRHRSVGAHRQAVACLVVALGVLPGCGGPRSVSTTELATNPDYYNGRTVIAQGVVLEFGGDGGAIPHHYVLQDAQVNRVELLPPTVAAPHVGSAVTVTGEFEYDEDRGRMLHVDTIEAVRASP